MNSSRMCSARIFAYKKEFWKFLILLLIDFSWSRLEISPFFLNSGNSIYFTLLPCFVGNPVSLRFPSPYFAISGKAHIFSFLNKFHTHKSKHVILLNYLLSNCSRFYCCICCKHQMVFIDMKHYSTYNDIKLRQGLDDMYASV